MNFAICTEAIRFNNEKDIKGDILPTHLFIKD
jgi:hypothetical protein